MRKGCNNIGSAIICGGEPSDHICNDEGRTYDTVNGERFFFTNDKEASDWYDKNFENVIAGSVACSICKRAEIDNSYWL